MLEITATDLTRNTAASLDHVERGDRVAVTRGTKAGAPRRIAVIVSAEWYKVAGQAMDAIYREGEPHADV